MAAAHRNPPWSRDELILALDLYLRHRPSQLSEIHPEVIALSGILNSLPVYGANHDSPTFRNPTGVSMKLGNLLRLDPDYHGIGLSRGGRLEEEIWQEYQDQPDEVRRLAEAIKRAVKEPARPTVGMEDEESFPEGAVLYRQHQYRERERSLVSRRKALGLQNGSLSCMACGFDFYQTYGEIGRGFIECHHTVPLSAYMVGQRTRLSDLALVCSNCHRMLHRQRPWLALNELGSLISR